jgi:hypothetical protein
MNGPVVKAFALVYRAGSNFWGASYVPDERLRDVFIP